MSTNSSFSMGVPPASNDSMAGLCYERIGPTDPRVPTGISNRWCNRGCMPAGEVFRRSLSPYTHRHWVFWYQAIHCRPEDLFTIHRRAETIRFSSRIRGTRIFLFYSARSPCTRFVSTSGSLVPDQRSCPSSMFGNPTPSPAALVLTASACRGLSFGHPGVLACVVIQPCLRTVSEGLPWRRFDHLPFPRRTHLPRQCTRP